LLIQRSQAAAGREILLVIHEHGVRGRLEGRAEVWPIALDEWEQGG
jgi:hypothetical protein